MRQRFYLFGSLFLGACLALGCGKTEVPLGEPVDGDSAAITGGIRVRGGNPKNPVKALPHVPAPAAPPRTA